MKKKLLNIVTALLTVLLLIPVFGTNPVNAATNKGQEFIAYVKNQGGIIYNTGDNGSCHTVDKTVFEFLHPGVIPNSNYEYDIFFRFDMNTYKVLDNKIYLNIYNEVTEIGQNQIPAEAFTAPLDLSYGPSKTITSRASDAALKTFRASDLNKFKSFFESQIPQVMKNFQIMLNQHGFSFSDFGFTDKAYKTSPSVVTPTINMQFWVGTDGSESNYADGTFIMHTMDVSGFASPIQTKIYYNNNLVIETTGPRFALQVSSTDNKSITYFEDGEIVIANKLQSVNGQLPAGTYAVKYYYGGKIIFETSCTVNRKDIITKLPAFTPTSGSGVEGFVTRLYKVVLGRTPDAAGKADWVKKLTNKSITGGDAATKFLTSSEFTAKKYLDDDFVEILYRTFFNRTGDFSGKQYWLKKMNEGMKRTDVIKSFVASKEWATICAEYGIASGSNTRPNATTAMKDFVKRLYTTCLGRTPSDSDVKYWADQLAAGTLTGSDAARKFFTSKEFTGRNYSNDEYVNRLYMTFLNRKCSASERESWVNKLKAGKTRQEVLNGFAKSAEFVNLCKNAGIIP